jgi:hypothetical protein
MRGGDAEKSRLGIHRKNIRLECQNPMINEQPALGEGKGSGKFINPHIWEGIPLRYSGNPVKSSSPSTFQLATLSNTSSKLYVIHIVNLWKGTRLSPWAIDSSEVFSTEQGQTSPSDIPANSTREGQIGFSPSIKHVQMAETGTTRLVPSIFD